ncbi:hypothetical protein TVAG_495530 [Trichomonas vaginalis G3]|uniref:Protein kinase domain-containing protein n=1 Tax=Trichomonas vaginalis (strain ATCC PRA-98 / G3) TaxID=412133 RepID=A2DVJ6_TRIV3|nr:protein kinase-like (PK-like) family [Trichomonas vaginalis G3]EAY15538.1 hypothetical protein TVAG_495530 [Trichomonas vaginalis G3]KAI5526184.1 protein kinase-like (PK-like) family [Trichomonas vaginalis G3]|eukprot:XP_001327761.1 hypothetical protein [Trichomonas vaginalis G3]
MKFTELNVHSKLYKLNETTILKVIENDTAVSNYRSFMQQKEIFDLFSQKPNSHIVQTSSPKVFGRWVYITMKRVPFCLTELINKLSEERLRFIMKQLVEIVQEFHKINFVNYNISTDNFLVDENDFVYIMNFGSGFYLNRQPFVFIQESSINWPSKAVYSLGLIFFHMLTGLSPYEMGYNGKNAIDIFLANPSEFESCYTRYTDQDLLLDCICQSNDRPIDVNTLAEIYFNDEVF